MIGPLLNYTQRCYNLVDSINTGYQYKEDLFGTGTTNYTITSGTTIYNRDLAARNGNSMEFNNLTVEAGAKLIPYVELSGTKGAEAQPGPWCTLFLKCFGTLTVNGTITTAQTGSRFNHYSSSHIITPSVTPIPINTGWYGYGFSSQWQNFFRLRNYGANKSLFDYSLAMFGGAGGGCHSWRHGPLHKRHYEHSYNWGINSGGGVNTDSGNTGGGSGGFVALYFRHLIISGREYGVDAGCDLSKVSANGIAFLSEQDRAGGSIVIAADTIVIGNSGTINSDAGSPYGVSYSRKLSFLNNIPQLCEYQEGYYWNPTVNTYSFGKPPSGVYYYDDGTAKGMCNRSASGSTSQTLGGAGICLGFKVK